MREISVPALVAARPQANLTDLVVENAEAFGHLVGYRRRGADGLWHVVTWANFRLEVEAVAKGLVASGVQAGDRVALMARTRYEWTLIDVAIWFAGAITVPIYETSSIEQVQWILTDSDARLCLVENPSHQATVLAAQERGAPAVPVLVIDDGAVAALTTAGSDVPADEIARRRATLDGSSIATLIYTSGTTGRPKGCELTHANFFELSLNTVQHRRPGGRAPTTPAPCCSCRWPTCSPGSSRCSASPRGQQLGPQPRRQEPARRPGGLSAHASCSPCHGCSRRSTTRPRPRPTADGKGKIFDDRCPHRHRLQRGPRRRRAEPGAHGPARSCSTSSSTPSCAAAWAGGSPSPCRAGRPWAPGSATSSAAQGSPSSRAGG